MNGPPPFRGRGNFPRFRGRGRGGRGFRPYWRGRKPARTDEVEKSESSAASSFTSPTPTSSSPSLAQGTLTSFVLSGCTYPGWKMYFPEEEFSDNSLTVTKTDAFEKYIQENGHLIPESKVIEEMRSYSVDYKALMADANFKEAWGEDFDSDLRNRPEHTIACLGLAMHQAIIRRVKEEMEETGSELICQPMIRARIFNFEPIMQLKQLKSNYYGKLVTVRGTIIRVGTIKLLCTWMAFECNTCQTLACIRQPEGIHSVPTKCLNDGCRSRAFTPLLSSPYTLTINWQSVRLQEMVTDEQGGGGRVPRNVDLELMADLVESCTPGDIVTVTGVVKVRNEEESKKKAANVFLLYLEVVSVINNKSQSGAGRAGVAFHMKDYYAIREIHSEPQLFRLLVHSLCPPIYGHEVVKAGLLLCMFGGCPRHVYGRADPHILVVGDPGLGKSRMLQSCANVAPRGVYVCGNTSTSSGLTVTLKREGGGDYALEAGALVLSDQGCCCIDEFDKMTNQHQALLEAMEQQTVSIAKAGVVCSLPARTSILAAANPVGGHYNKAKTVSENLKLGPALLSRFDLVFILLDQPNEYLDSMLSEHVMALHSGVKSSTVASSVSSIHSNVDASQASKSHLQQRLKLLPGEELDVIPHQLLRKYIAYARKYVKPRLSAEAGEVLQQFYLELRRFHQGADCTPVTTRQLESLIRLTEARAKLELREIATIDDANDTVEILKASMVDTWSDAVGALDISRSLNGSGMSSRNQAKAFISALQRTAELQGRSMFSIQDMKEVAQRASLNISDFSSFLSTLNVQGILLKKGPKLYQLLSAD